jgi:hypothetical protein
MSGTQTPLSFTAQDPNARTPTSIISRNLQYGDGHPGEGDIRGNKRGVVSP